MVVVSRCGQQSASDGNRNVASDNSRRSQLSALRFLPMIIGSTNNFYLEAWWLIEAY